MSRSNMYAQVVDVRPVLATINEHANQGLPFISLEYGDDYLKWTQKGESTMPSLDEIESRNLDGIAFGTGVSIRTADGHNVSVVPLTREEAYKPLNEIERRIFDAAKRADDTTNGELDDEL